jgi:hypothetical protein
VFWNSDPFHILNFDDIDDVEKNTLEAGKSALLWIDASDQNAPPISGDEPANETLGQPAVVLT